MLELKRPLIVFDVETTGVHPQVDRVVQLGLVKAYPDGGVTEWQSLVNPGMPIPPEATHVHGIADADVKDAPTFASLAPKLAAGFQNCDVGGFNVRFDILFLKKELDLVHRGWSKVLEGARVVDAFRIYTQRKPRTLVAAVKDYLREDLPDAHDALVDARASYRVLLAQLEQHPELPGDVNELHKVFFETPAEGHLDPDGKLAWRYGVATINFGKWATCALNHVDRSYLTWMLENDFSPEVKRIVVEALKGNVPRRDA